MPAGPSRLMATPQAIHVAGEFDPKAAWVLDHGRTGDCVHAMLQRCGDEGQADRWRYARSITPS